MGENDLQNVVAGAWVRRGASAWVVGVAENVLQNVLVGVGDGADGVGGGYARLSRQHRERGIEAQDRLADRAAQAKNVATARVSISRVCNGRRWSAFGCDWKIAGS